MAVALGGAVGSCSPSARRRLAAWHLIQDAPYVRYIDTGSRDPKHALGTWFADVVNDKAEVVALRIQTAFFAAGALGYFEPTLRRLSANSGLTRLLVGSNDGGTQRAEVVNLLAVVGGPRAGLEVGVVSFESGYFPPEGVPLRKVGWLCNCLRGIGEPNLGGRPV